MVTRGRDGDAGGHRLSIAPLNRNASLLSLVSEIARFLGSAMGIAIANRKNRCDFGALCSEFGAVNRGQKRHINIWHINNFSVTPVTDTPGWVPGHNVWVPHTPRKSVGK